MTFHEFHNGLRVLLNIDGEEFLNAVYGIDRKPDDSSAEWGDWILFQRDPHRWFIRAPDAKAQAIFKIVEERSR